MTYGHNIPRVRDYEGTTLINTYERFVLEIPDVDFPQKDRGQLLFKTRQKYAPPKDTGLVLQ